MNVGCIVLFFGNEIENRFRLPIPPIELNFEIEKRDKKKKGRISLSDLKITGAHSALKMRCLSMNNQSQ